MPHPDEPVDPELSFEALAGQEPEHTRSAPSDRRAPPRVLGAIAVGGALGATARSGLAHLVVARADAFPWATLLTNVSGSFLLGLVLAVIVRRFPSSRHLRTFVASGFLGAYTTFSTFAVETDLLLRAGHAASAITYVASSLFAGLGAAWTGLLIGRAAVAGSPRPGDATP